MIERKTLYDSRVYSHNILQMQSRTAMQPEHKPHLQSKKQESNKDRATLTLLFVNRKIPPRKAWLSKSTFAETKLFYSQFSMGK